MGAWGPGVFENDDACDWVFELVESEQLSAVDCALDATLEADEDLIDASPSCNALAAAEVVAALAGRRGKGLTEEVSIGCPASRRPLRRLL